MKCVLRVPLYHRLHVGSGLYDPRGDELTSWRWLVRAHPTLKCGYQGVHDNSCRILSAYGTKPLCANTFCCLSGWNAFLRSGCRRPLIAGCWHLSIPKIDRAASVAVLENSNSNSNNTNNNDNNNNNKHNN